MSDSEDFFPPSLLLKEACPTFFNALVQHFSGIGASDMICQLEAVWVAAQVISGTEVDFSFMAYPLPRLTAEQRASMDFVGADRIQAKFDGAQVIIDLDDFGRINWFRVTNCPHFFVEIKRSLGRRAGVK